ncbi:hypothetical protein [Thermodesulfitimonas autotrophica]|uniref:hypothetical protein n=1 Tax=Thermodesulfitimonas autotrophica TaxID=1894989 RepID=UPI002FE387A1
MTAAAVLTATPHVVNRSCRWGGSGEMVQEFHAPPSGSFYHCGDPGGQDYPPAPPEDASGALKVKMQGKGGSLLEQGDSVLNDQVAQF